MKRDETDRCGFIRAHTRLRAVAHVPEIALHLADEATELWAMTEDALGVAGLPPPFWAFAWAGGQALARHILDHPALVAGTRVLDAASGSDLVAIAAARAGAAIVEANDIDSFALAAIALNGVANGVAPTIRPGDLLDRDDGWDVVLAADVFYEHDLATRVTAWLRRLGARGARVLVGDPGRTYLDRDAFERVATHMVPVDRTLEDADVKETAIWQPRPPAETS